MDLKSPNLDNLPVELLRQIASSGPCESVLALLRVNKTLQHVCNDQQVFKALLENCNGHSGPSWQSVPLLTESPTSSWARYALADSKAREWSADEASYLGSRFLSWAPQLMAASHPLVNSADILKLFNIFELIEDENIDESYALALCLTLRLMSGVPSHLLTPTLRVRRFDGLQTRRLQPSPGPWAIAQEKLCLNYLTQPLIEPMPKRITMKHAIIVVGILTARSGRFRLGLPRSPYLSLSTLPLPFSPDTARELSTCHILSMTDRIFLEDGEWMGFSQTLDTKHSMRGIRFLGDTSYDGILNLHAQGSRLSGPIFFDDKTEPILIFGQIDQKTSKATLRETRGGLHFDWTCVMTPFGLVGTWGSVGNSGQVWLWKASSQPTAAISWS